MEQEDVYEVYDKLSTVSTASRTLTVLERNKRGINLAVVDTSPGDLHKLEKIGHIKISFVSCKISRRNYGHKMS